ncbi:hypothetical protein SpCBS45565_g07930 [Spizellomyces sp. 'palustris']|nr:hypothetical protein SpCBS45565_g07930 [Spizellomyces sp. 'palustris']
MAAPTLEHNRLRLDKSPSEIQAHTEEIIAKARIQYDQIAALTPDQCNFESIIKKMATVDNWLGIETNNVTFPQYVSPDKAVRDAAVEANKLLDEFEIQQSMREDLFKAVQATAAKKEQLDPESARLLEFTERDFKRNGLALPKEKRDELEKLKKKLADASTEFSKNMNEDKTEVLFTKDELEGMPDDFLEGLTKKVDEKDGVEKYAVTMKYPDIIPTLRMANREETRKRLDIANGQKCQANVAILEGAVAVREQIAKLLGYKDHASYILEVKMAKDAKSVDEFLKKLRERLTPFGQKELQRLLELKKKEKASRNEPFDNKINSWDFQYYNRLLLESEYSVNDEEIKQYFSLETVTQGMLDLYQTVLSIRFKEVEKPPVWHADVRLFEVFDHSGEFMGHFYLDLHPREGKYTHAAVFGLQPGCESSDGKRQYPVAAMVANFSKPTAAKPSLLKHSEVTTYFHELGHVMHQICSVTRFSRFHGTRVERDFVEAPSQMLENWCWEAGILQKLSAHYEKGPSHPLPSNLIESLVKAKNVNAALLNLRQIFFGWFDFTLHTTPSGGMSTTDLWNKLREEVTLIPGTPDTWPAAAFGHIMGGYDAGYYGYLWSQVFSADMFFSRFKVEGVQNPATGLSYRNDILGPGGSRDGMDMLRNFLGREPRDEAFLKSIGLVEVEEGAAGGAPVVI